MALTPAQMAVIQAGIAANRVILPPAQLAGMGIQQISLQPAVFGGMAMLTPVPQTFGTADSLVTVFDNPFPIPASGLNPEGAYYDSVTDSLTTISKGIFLVSLVVAGTIPAGADFKFTVAVDGVASRVFVGAGASNQTSEFFASVCGMVTSLVAEPVLTLLGRADQAGRVFTFGNCVLQVLRVR